MITSTVRTKSFGALLVAALFVALLPALPVFASPPGSAQLTAGTSGFPTADGETRDFTVEVTNSGTAVESVNWVRVFVPKDEAGVTLTDDTGTPPSGWSASTGNNPFTGAEYITYTADSMFSGIPGGGSQSFTFPAEVARPVNSEETGGFTVSISDDSGETTTQAHATDGTLLTTVEILEVVNDVAPRAPEGVTDGTATGGQTVQMGYSVVNHALQAVNVTGSLASGNTAVATVSDPDVTLSVPGDPNASTLFTHTVSTSAPTSDTTVGFTASAASSGADAEQNPTGNLTVQVPSDILLSPDSFSPSLVNSGMGTDGTEFTIDGGKDGTPALTVTQGSLSFASTSADLVGTPYTFGADQELTFRVPDGEQIVGNDGIYDVTFTFPGVTDENGFTRDLSVTLEDLLEIDNIAPDITLDVEIPEGQNAVKNGDTISVSGTITGSDADPGSLEVVLTPDIGESQTVEVSTTSTEDGYTFSGSVEADFEDGRADDSQAEQEQPSGDFAKVFDASASVLDGAGNLGGVTVEDAALVDNVIPALSDPGRTGQDANGNSIIQIGFDDFHPLADSIAGACDPGLYRIDGVPGRVSEVLGADGGACDPTTSDSGTRTLVLNYQLDEDATPTVTYDPSPSGLTGFTPANDGADNDALMKTVDTVVGIAPAPPEIVEVTRNQGAEDAYRDSDGEYWTRFDGDDLTVSFTGYQDGYIIQVLDEGNNVLNSKELNRDQIGGEDAPGEDGQDSITVPLPTGAADGEYVRRLRFISSAEAPPGVPETLTINLDTVAPAIASLTQDVNDITVSFNDQLVAGSNFASDWFGWEDRGGDRRMYQATEVTTTENPGERLVRFSFEDPTLFGGVAYFLNSDGERYEDRAGNTLADQEFAG